MKPLLQPQQLYDYQRECIAHMLTEDDSMLWLGLGLGKTPVTLTTIVDRMRAGHVKKTLVFGPLRVIQAVWAREARKWEHTKHLRFSVMHGTKEKRTRALFADADIFLCNYENMNWLAETLTQYYLDQDKPLPFQMVVYDEVSKLKNSTTKRMGGGKTDRKDKRGNVHTIKHIGWRKILDHFKYRVGLTGTPASNGYLDLHGQFLAVDGGKRLGPYVTGFKDAYFVSDYNGWNYVPTDLGKKAIETNIADITKKMDAKDYLDLPDVNVTNLMVDLPEKARKAYIDMEKEMFSELDSGTEVEVFSRASVSNKCLQFCIAQGTEVLTSTGWSPIENVGAGDFVWDGDGWASVGDLAVQGNKRVIELDGVWMTPDHKVLTVSGWREAQEIIHGDAREGLDRPAVRIPEGFRESRNHCNEESDVEREMCLREGVCGNRMESEESQPTGREILRVQEGRGPRRAKKHTWDVIDQTICNLGEYAQPVQEPERQRLPELWWSWDRSLRRVVRFFREFLEGHGWHVQGRSVHRARRQRGRVLPVELQVGDDPSTSQQPEELPVRTDAFRCDDSGAGCEEVRRERGDAESEAGQRDGRTEGNHEHRYEETYDLVDVGTSNRFTVRGSSGDVFIVHNCNGTPYHGESKEWEALHDAKLDALEDVLEEAAGKPVLCSYTFKSDAERIMKKFSKYRPVNLTTVKSSATEDVINKWNDGKIKLLIGHPASMGHGVDGLQDSGSILVWFGLNWSLELYEQMNGRIDRQGQKDMVSIIRILCRDTVDLAVADALTRKTDDQNTLKDAIQRYRDGIVTNDLEVNFF